MKLRDRINQDLTAAMKAREAERLSVLRMVKTAIKNKEIESLGELDDLQAAQVLSTLIKQRKDSIEQFNRGGRTELAEKEAAEITIIEQYLPAARFRRRNRGRGRRSRASDRRFITEGHRLGDEAMHDSVRRQAGGWEEGERPGKTTSRSSSDVDAFTSEQSQRVTPCYRLVHAFSPYLWFSHSLPSVMAQVRLARVSGEPGRLTNAATVVLQPSGNIGYVTNPGSGLVEKFRTITGDTVGSTPLPQGIGPATLSPDSRTLAVLGVTSQRLYLINTATMTLRNEGGYTRSGFTERSNILFSQDGSRIFVADPSRDHVAVFNASDATVVRFLVGGNRSQHNVFFPGW